MGKCGYCWGGYCANEDVRAVQLRTAIGGKWDAEKTTAGTKCREYLRGHFKFVKEKPNAVLVQFESLRMLSIPSVS